MKIRELYLKNFGKFSEKSICFGDGINVIYGKNEAGKTTIYNAVGAMLFGMERQRGRASQRDTYKTYQPWEYPTFYAGSMKFETGGKLFRIDRNFYQNEKSARLLCETDGEELSVEQGDLAMLLGDVTEELFFNTAAAGQLQMKPKDIVYGYLKNYIVNLQENGGGNLDVAGALENLERKRKELERQKKRENLRSGSSSPLSRRSSNWWIGNFWIAVHSFQKYRAGRKHFPQNGRNAKKVFGKDLFYGSDVCFSENGIERKKRHFRQSA